MFLALLVARLPRRRHLSKGLHHATAPVGLLVTFSLQYHSPLYSAVLFAFSECMSAVGWLIWSFVMDMLAITNRARPIFVRALCLRLERRHLSWTLKVKASPIINYHHSAIISCSQNPIISSATPGPVPESQRRISFCPSCVVAA
jgi:hypothetical protein